MSNDLEVAKGEWGVTRVFSLDIAPEVALRAAAGAGDEAGLLADLLGVNVLDLGRVEVFVADDLGDLSVSQYLVEGYGIAPDAVNAKRQMLDALNGPIAIVASAAFGGRAAMLTPQAPLILVATFREPAAVPSMDAIPSAAAAGTLRSPSHEAPASTFVGAPRWLVIGCLLAAVAVVLLVVMR
ncbi:MAG: hypothetical protein AAF771_02725 [Pseudomonadota bacterium]